MPNAHLESRLQVAQRHSAAAIDYTAPEAGAAHYRQHVRCAGAAGLLHLPPSVVVGVMAATNMGDQPAAEAGVPGAEAGAVQCQAGSVVGQQAEVAGQAVELRLRLRLQQAQAQILSQLVLLGRVGQQLQTGGRDPDKD